MTNLVIAYERRSSRVLSLSEFADEQRDEALAMRDRLEMDHRNEPDVEVVLLSADSREALEETHGRYFRSPGQLIFDQVKALLRAKPLVPRPN